MVSAIFNLKEVRSFPPSGHWPPRFAVLCIGVFSDARLLVSQGNIQAGRCNKTIKASVSD